MRIISVLQDGVRDVSGSVECEIRLECLKTFKVKRCRDKALYMKKEDIYDHFSCFALF